MCIFCKRNTKIWGFFANKTCNCRVPTNCGHPVGGMTLGLTFENFAGDCTRRPHARRYDAGVLQCVAVCCRCVAVCCSVLQCVAVCCSVLQCVAMCCSVLQRVAVYCILFLHISIFLSCFVLQCMAVYDSVWHCVATQLNTLQQFVVSFDSSPSATHCNILQHTATVSRVS